MNALVSQRFLQKEGARYSLTPESARFLVTNSPTFLGGFIHHNVHSLLPAWQQLETVVRTGKPARNLDREQQGVAFFREFVPALFTLSRAAAAAFAEAILRKRGAGFDLAIL